MTKRPRFSGEVVIALFVAAVGLVGGCQLRRSVEPVIVRNPTFGPMTVAVAPALNLSGGTNFDPARVADLMAAELSYTEGISVVPVSRVLGALAAAGMESVESPDHALSLVRSLGADAIIVFAVTEYDPYDPPRIAIAAQLYGTRPGTGGNSVDPMELSRQARLTASHSSTGRPGILARSQRVYDAAHESVISDLKAFAAFRGASESPYGWRKYVVSQQHFLEYCCHVTIRELMGDRVYADPIE